MFFWDDPDLGRLKNIISHRGKSSEQKCRWDFPVIKIIDRRKVECGLFILNKSGSKLGWFLWTKVPNTRPKKPESAKKRN